MLKFIKKIGLAAASTTVLASTLAFGVVMFAQPQMASAACNPQDQFPETNVLYCGLDSNSASHSLSLLESAYNANTNDPHNGTAVTHDIKDIFGHSSYGFQAGWFTSGQWVIGTSYKDGTIRVNGQVVGTNVQIASRCYPSGGYCLPQNKYALLTSNVYTRDATWFFDKDVSSKPTLVHLDANGVADFALWAPCSNMLLFKQVPPKPTLNCKALTKSLDSSSETQVTYTFTATAEGTNNPTITTYKFDFGDGSTPKNVDVKNNATTASITYTYDARKLTNALIAKVFVNNTISSANCETPIPAQQVLTCTALTDDKKSNTEYTFTATIHEQNVSNGKLQINFGDGTTTDLIPVTKDGFTYTTAVHTYTVQELQQGVTIFAVTGINGLVKSEKCQTTLKLGQLSFACQALTTPGPDSSTSGSRTYTFTASVKTGSTYDTPANYQLFYSEDNGAVVGTAVQNVTTSSTTFVQSFTFDSASVHTFNLYFVATSATGLTTDKNDKNCQSNFSTQPLINTGPGDTLALAGGATILSTGIYQIILRRRTA